MSRSCRKSWKLDLAASCGGGRSTETTMKALKERVQGSRGGRQLAIRQEHRGRHRRHPVRPGRQARAKSPPREPTPRAISLAQIARRRRRPAASRRGRFGRAVSELRQFQQGRRTEEAPRRRSRRPARRPIRSSSAQADPAATPAPTSWPARVWPPPPTPASASAGRCSGPTTSPSRRSRSQTATLVGPFEQEAIRPHVFGRFEDMLVASSSHPAMLLYLDQAQSVGPDTMAAAFLSRSGKQRRAEREPRPRDHGAAHGRAWTPATPRPTSPSSPGR